MSDRFTASWKNCLTAIALLVIVCAACSVSNRAPTPARGFHYRGQAPEPNRGAYGYVVFPSMPTAETRPRYERVCEAFMRDLRPTSDFGDSEPQSLMVTYWLLTPPPVTEGAALDCKQLVDKYDYTTANEIAASVQHLSATGPVLVAWGQPFENSPAQADALILDMSRFADEDLDRAFGIWKDRIVRNQAAWKDGFNLVIIREDFRNLIQKYGEQILQIIKKG